MKSEYLFAIEQASEKIMLYVGNWNRKLTKMLWKYLTKTTFSILSISMQSMCMLQFCWKVFIQTLVRFYDLYVVETHGCKKSGLANAEITTCKFSFNCISPIVFLTDWNLFCLRLVYERKNANVNKWFQEPVFPTLPLICPKFNLMETKIFKKCNSLNKKCCLW